MDRSDFVDDSEKDVSVLSVDGIEIYRIRPSTIGVEAPGVDVGTFACTFTAPTHYRPAQCKYRCLKNKHFTRFSCMPTLRQVHAILKEYSPLIYFHPKEKYLCSSLDFLFSNGTQLFHSENGSAGPGTAITANGANLPQGGTNDGSYWIGLPADANWRKIS